MKMIFRFLPLKCRVHERIWEFFTFFGLHFQRKDGVMTLLCNFQAAWLGAVLNIRAPPLLPCNPNQDF